MAKEDAPEKPQIEEPKEPQAKELTPEERMAAVISKLDGMGITDEAKVDNLAHAASQAGKYANEVGELRDVVNQLRQENERLARQPARPTEMDEYGQPTQSVDLERMMRNIVQEETKNFYHNEVIKPQRELQTKYYEEMNAVQSDPDYKSVEKIFNEHVSSPQVMTQLQAGMTSIGKEYDKTVRAWYRTSLKAIRDGLVGSTPKVEVPHVEGQAQQPVMPSTDDEKEEKRQQTIKARKAGDISSDDAVDELLRTELNINPEDPFFQFGD